VKVKSLVGVTGDEIEDQLAVAATGSWDMNISDFHTEPYEDMGERVFPAQNSDNGGRFLTKREREATML